MDTEFRIVWPDGSIHWVTARGKHQWLAEGGEKFVGIGFEVSDFKRLENELRLSERRYRMLLASSSSIVWFTDAFGNVTQPILSYEQFTGATWPNYRGKEWRGAFHDDDAARIEREWSSATSLGKEFETTGRLWNEPSSSWRWVHVRAVPLADKAGRVEEWIGSITDVHDLHSAHEQQAVLISELRHRIKNTLAVVQALATQSRRYASGDPMQTFIARLHALSRAHDLVMAAAWADILLADIVKQTVKPFTDGKRIRIEGPAVRVQANTSIYIALAFYELATNATKYGALSVPNGRVDITWKRGQGPDGWQVFLEWRESGGPPIESEPQERGFGLRLIENAVSREPRGSTEIRFEPTGLVCRMSFLEMKRPAKIAAWAS
jgi:PAS domain S-box-containing protein